MKSTPLVSMKREEGQSIIMITFILVVLIALVALVVDVGNAYAQRRIAQNAADAAAMAATRELARGADITTNSAVLSEARQYAQLNGIDPNTVSASYFSFNPSNGTTTDLGVVPNTGTRPPSNANGVTVNLGKTFNAYLAQVVGRRVLAAGASSSGQVSKGACTAGESGGLFPMAIDDGTFNNTRDNGKPTTYINYRVWGDKTTPGNFRWLSWGTTGDTGVSTLVANLQSTSRSGRRSTGQEVFRGASVTNDSSVTGQLTVRVANSDSLRPAKVVLPIYDRISGSGSSTSYRIKGFAWYVITGYNFQGSDKYVEGYFLADALPGAVEAGCLDYGTSTVKIGEPIDLTRNIAGHVAYNYLKVERPSGQTDFPVDAVLVIDKSGSMDQNWGSPQVKKIDTAKSSLTAFVNMLRQDIGDQGGLVRFPIDNEIGSSYYPSCNIGGRTSYRLRAQILNQLTPDLGSLRTSVASLNAIGGTPIADAMEKAIEVITGPNHVAGRPQIIILASDGMTNATLDERWTGYSGNTTSGMGGCNGQAEAEATNMANQAKAQGITVFTVAIGDDFSGAVLSAMSTPNTDPSKPHYFLASNPTAMQQIYADLGERVVNFGDECTVTALDAPGNGATVRLYKGGTLVATTVADASGSFIFSDNITAGTYTFSATVTKDTLTYDVATDTVGGTDLTSAPSLVVPEAEGTYSIHLALRTAHPPSCGGG